MKLSIINNAITLVSAYNGDLQTNNNLGRVDNSSIAPEMLEPSLYIPQGVTHISEGALSACKKVEKIYLPAHIQEIDDSTIATLPNLKNIVINNVDEYRVEEIKNLLSTPELRDMLILDNQFSDRNMEEFYAWVDTVDLTKKRPAPELSGNNVLPIAKTPAVTAPIRREIPASSSWASFCNNIFVTRPDPVISELKSILRNSRADSEAKAAPEIPVATTSTQQNAAVKESLFSFFDEWAASPHKGADLYP